MIANNMKQIIDRLSIEKKRRSTFKATITYEDCQKNCTSIASKKRIEARSKKINDRRHNNNKAAVVAAAIEKIKAENNEAAAKAKATANANIKTTKTETTAPTNKTTTTTVPNETAKAINDIDMEIAMLKAMLYPYSTVNAPTFTVKKTQHEIFIDEYSQCLMKEFNKLLVEGEFVKKPKHVKLGKHRVSAFFHLDRP